MKNFRSIVRAKHTVLCLIQAGDSGGCLCDAAALECFLSEEIQRALEVLGTRHYYSTEAEALVAAEAVLDEVLSRDIQFQGKPIQRSQLFTVADNV